VYYLFDPELFLDFVTENDKNIEKWVIEKFNDQDCIFISPYLKLYYLNHKQYLIDNGYSETDLLLLDFNFENLYNKFAVGRDGFFPENGARAAEVFVNASKVVASEKLDIWHLLIISCAMSGLNGNDVFLMVRKARKFHKMLAPFGLKLIEIE